VTRRVRVVVLGGGCAGIAAAEDLSATEERRRRFEVVVVQPGHRLGGKGATGRNAAQGQRIEEHGLHVWMGFYQRSFRMMRRCFEEWDAPHDAPIRTIEQAFAPHDTVTAVGPGSAASGGLDLWTTRLPPRPGKPWDDGPDGVDWASFGKQLFRFGVTGFGDAARTIRDEGDDVRRRLAVLGRLALAAARGLLVDVLPHGEAGFDRIDAHDLRDWLVRHGARRDDVRDAPLLRCIYDLAFSYPDGDGGPGRGRIAAGAALKSMMLIAGAYRGAPFWRMRAGMGDTIFAPLHEVLRARGVRFDFFRRVERLRADASGVGAIALGVQATPRGGAYDPLVTVRGQPCWPGEPRWDQLEEGDALRGRGIDFESNLRPFRASGRELARGVDFDEVVLAIPAPVHGAIAEDLVAKNARYRAMLDATHAVPTIAAQLWLQPGVAELGWKSSARLLTGARGLFASWGDMTDVADLEAWPKTPGSIAYFCEACPAALRDREGDPVGARRRLREHATAWLDRELCQLWPDARGDDGRFRRDLLVAQGTDDGDGDPWDAQYLRLNDDPSEQYVMSLPGTTAARLAPRESGFDNLVFAGDWTRTRINGGSVEAAVESGQEAARAIREKHGVA
jgi:uncharacterized protein with NAD-binding domain and iron-sulfur cluster